ncbi:unnamed protein product [Caenorhabditis angaria]|uniref:G protein-coupled receptor n=1 Tax=Caenorhabditis angaria TaxID=860376 RepID=A0A9P1N958_9PELO|nr:unnamed protein product [Caenorhabditis angaria]
MAIFPIFTLPIYLEAFYCMLWKSPNMNKTYLRVLIIHVLINVISEVYGFLLIRPVVILPIIGLYSKGLLSYIEMNTFIQTFLLFFLIQINAAVILHLFLLRLNIMIPITYKRLRKLGKFMVFFIYIAAISGCTNFKMLIEDQNYAKQVWTVKLHNNIPSNFWTENYVVSSGDSEKFTLFLISCAVTFIVYGFLCAIVTALAFYFLSKSKSQTSNKAVEGHKMYIYSLIMQIIAFLVAYQRSIAHNNILKMAEFYDFDAQDRLIETLYEIAHWLLIVTLPIHFYGLYCVFWQSPHFHRAFVWPLGLHVFLSALEEVINIAVRPVVYVPIIGIFADGIFTSTFNINAFIQIIFIILLVQLNASALIHISFYRLKVIMPITFRYYKLVYRFGLIFLILIYVTSTFSIFGFSLLYEDQFEAKSFYQQKLSTLPKCFWQENFVVSTGRSANFEVFIDVATLFLIFHVFLACAILAIAHFILSRTKSRMSEKVLAAQRSYLNMLLIRILTLLFLNIIPFSVFALAMKHYFEDPFILMFSIFLSSTYGAASTLTLILFTRPYRNFLLHKVIRKTTNVTTIIKDGIDHS